MKRILLAILIIASGCSHTTEENYTMIHKVVGELGTIKDSIDYVHTTISANLPGSEEHIVSDKKGTRYEEGYINLVSKNDSTHGKMMKRYNILFEHYNTYQEMFGLIYKELPKDSAAKNEAIRKEFDAAIK